MEDYENPKIREVDNNFSEAAAWIGLFLWHWAQSGVSPDDATRVIVSALKPREVRSVFAAGCDHVSAFGAVSCHQVLTTKQ